MIKHSCIFCKEELNFDYEGTSEYFRCTKSGCMVTPFSKYEFGYIDGDISYRAIILNIGDINYRIFCSYLSNSITIEALQEVIDNKDINSRLVKYNLPISLLQVENYTIPPTADPNKIKDLVLRLFRLKAFL